MEKLNAEDRELLRSFEADEWEPVRPQGAELERFAEYATATPRKDEPVNKNVSGRFAEKD